MKKETIVRLIIAVLFFALVVLLCSCGAQPEVKARERECYERFEVIERVNFSSPAFFFIVKDTNTNVLYAMSKEGTLTLLVNSVGSPMLDSNE